MLTLSLDMKKVKVEEESQVLCEALYTHELKCGEVFRVEIGNQPARFARLKEQPTPTGYNCPQFLILWQCLEVEYLT